MERSHYPLGFFGAALALSASGMLTRAEDTIPMLDDPYASMSPRRMHREFGGGGQQKSTAGYDQRRAASRPRPLARPAASPAST